MVDLRELPRLVRVVALVVAGLFLALSLVGYDPNDAPSASISPANAQPSNPCGPVGAWIAAVSFRAVGWGSHWFWAAWAFTTARHFLRRPMGHLSLRIAGFGLVVFTTSGLLAAVWPDLGPSHPVGSGGYLGSGTVMFLRGTVGPLGLALALASTFLLGVYALHDLMPVPKGIVIRGRGRSGGAGVGEYAGSASRPYVEIEDEDRGLGRVPFGLEVSIGTRVDQPHRERVPTTTAAVQPTPALTGRAAVPARATAAGNGGVPSKFQLPGLDLLEAATVQSIMENEARIQQRALMLEKTLLEHGCVVRVVQIDTGPVITQFEIELEAGLRVSKIVGLANDLAIALAVPSVRIVAPIPGKTTVGIEVPNERRSIVKLMEVIAGTHQILDRMRIPLFLGKDVKGQPLAFDLAEMPHLLIAGRTGTGKSVCLNAMILSILMSKRPDEVKLILIDPKMVELSQFKQIPHLMHPVVTDMKKAESLLAWACEKMDERYAFLQRAGVRNIQSYNQLGADEIMARLRPEDDEEAERIPTHMPYIVIIADEMADLMLTAAKEVEQHIVRLAQKSRAVGMHLIVATQKPTVDVVTGLIKGNLPARIAFQVASRSDSRVVLDEMGAERLLGNGDMLFLFPGTSHLVRAQGTYVADREVERVAQFLSRYPVEFNKELVQMQVGGALGGKDRSAALKERDELYEASIEVVIREQRGSCSLLQRALGIGYGRAARLIDYMAEDGIVGEFKSGSAREVLYSWEDWERMKGSDGE